MRTANDGGTDLVIGLLGLSGIEVARKARRKAAGLRLPGEVRRGEDAVNDLARRVVSLGGTPRVTRGRLSDARGHLPALAIGDEGELLLVTEVTRTSVTTWESGSERRLSHAEAARRLGSDVVALLAVDDPAPLSALGGHGDEHPSPLRRLVALATLERRDLTIVLVYAAAIGVLSLAVPVTVQALVSSVAALGLLTPIVVLSFLLFGVLGLAAVLRALSAWVVERLQQRLFVRVAEDLVHRFTHAKLEALSKGSAGDMANRFFEVLVLQKGAQSLLLDGAGVALQVVVGALLLAVYHPLLLGFGLAVVVILLALLFITGRGAVDTSLAESKQKYRVAAWIDEVARHPGAFRSRSSGAFARAATEELVRSYLVERRAHFRHVFRQNLVALGMQAVVTSALFGVGGWLASTGRISLGQLVAAEIVLASVVGGFAKLGKHLEVLYDLLTASTKLGHLVDLPLPEGAGVLPVPGEGPLALDVHGVSYGHPEGGGVRGVSLSVRPGEIVAVVGPNGAGKSTLLDLLAGLRAPREGRVLVAGADERGIDPELLREAVVVLRREPLFEGTIADNVAVGRPDVGPEEVRDALVATGLADVVSALPLAELTELGPSGAPLSPGQCRALLVARAVAGRPRAILVDGLVDDLDQATQDTLLASFRRDRAATVVLATSDAHLGERCDRSIRLHDGRLEEAS